MHGLRGCEDQNSLPKAARRRLTVKGRFCSGPVLYQKYELTLLAESNAHGTRGSCALLERRRQGMQLPNPGSASAIAVELTH